MELTEPQAWTMIGVFAAVMFAAITVLLRQNERIIASIRGEIGARLETIDLKFSPRLDAVDATFDARFGGMHAAFDARFEVMDAQFHAINVKLDERLGSIDRRLEDLDKEVATLTTRFWKSS